MRAWCVSIHAFVDQFPHAALSVQAAIEVGIPTLPATLTEAMADDNDFLRALYHVLMNVHVVRGTLTCPVTGRQFDVTNEIPNMILDEDECEHVRY